MSLKISKLVSAKRNDFQLVVSDIDIEEKQAVSIIGANGSGKTSLMESLLGLTSCVERDIYFFDQDIKTFEKKTKNKKRLGVQLQKSQFNKELNVKDLVQLYKVMYGKSCEYIYTSLNIIELLHLRYEKLSRGQRQRVDLYLALAHEPELIFLDEPNTGLDARYRKVLANLLLRLKDNNSTILMASHTSYEIDMCEKVLWMVNGSVKDFGTFEEVTYRAVGKYKLEVVCNASEIFEDIISFIKKENDVKAIYIDAANLEATVNLQNNILSEILNLCSEEHYSNISITECKLNDLIIGNQLSKVAN
jgi:ABC-2 type transport system ATP-binding protein